MTFPYTLDRIRQEYLTGQRYLDLADHIFWEDSFGSKPVDPRFVDGGIVFCKIDRVWDCFGQLVRKPARVILITGQGDFPIDDSRIRDLPANVAAWFGTNAEKQDGARIHSLPLGLGDPKDPITLTAAAIADARATGSPRTKWVYANFRPETNPAIRQPIFDYFAQAAHEPWVTFQPPAAHGVNQSYLDALITHRFVACPRGFGIDTHRMWEALYAGAIPILQESPAMRPFRGLPIWWVKDFSEVTESTAREMEARIRQSHWNNEMLFWPYWQEKILTARATIQSHPRLSLPEWTASFSRAALRRCLPPGLKSSF